MFLNGDVIIAIIVIVGFVIVGFLFVVELEEEKKNNNDNSDNNDNRENNDKPKENVQIVNQKNNDCVQINNEMKHVISNNLEVNNTLKQSPHNNISSESKFEPPINNVIKPNESDFNPEKWHSFLLNEKDLFTVILDMNLLHKKIEEIKQDIEKNKELLTTKDCQRILRHYDLLLTYILDSTEGLITLKTEMKNYSVEKERLAILSTIFLSDNLERMMDDLHSMISSIKSSNKFMYTNLHTVIEFYPELVKIDEKIYCDLYFICRGLRLTILKYTDHPFIVPVLFGRQTDRYNRLFCEKFDKLFDTFSEDNL